ncbi:MAG: universal stress protein [Candidatus Binatia bacterium]
MIVIKKILVPTDLSNISVPAIGYAISLAGKLPAEVTVLHAFPIKAMQEHFSQSYVPDGLVTPAGVKRQPDLDSVLEAKKQLIYSFLQQNIGVDLLKTAKVNPVVRFGKTAEEIIAAAKEEQSDLIVMTSHGFGLTRLFRGSLTERIVRRAPCPVLSIQPSAEVRTEQDNRVQVRLIDKWAA